MPDRISPEEIFLRDDDAPTLQGRVASAIVRSILGNRASPGTVLPSSRKLASQLGVSRMTVTLVYQELSSQGYLNAAPRSGVKVASTVPHSRIKPPENTAENNPQPLHWSSWLVDEPERKRVILKPANWRDFKYPFIYGQPDPKLFDYSAWRDCALNSLGARDFAELSSDSYGNDDPLLVDYICTKTLLRRGIQATPDQVMVTLGAQNGLYLAIELLARANRLVVAEEPGYPDFAELLRAAQSPAKFVQVDSQGLNPARIPEDARLVIVTPSHHIPTGATMPMARRRELIERAKRNDFLIIEDDYDFEMSYLAPPAPALKSLDNDGRVIYLGSFSKSLFPGLRIGYMVAPAPFIARARKLRSMMLRHPPGHLQRITAHFLALGYYDTHIKRLRETLKLRREAIVDALMPTDVEIMGKPEAGGSSMWLRAPGEVDSDALARHLQSKSVLIEPGAAFFETPPTPCPYFRIGFGSIDSAQIPDGIKLIADAL